MDEHKTFLPIEVATALMNLPLETFKAALQIHGEPVSNGIFTVKSNYPFKVTDAYCIGLLPNFVFIYQVHKEYENGTVIIDSVNMTAKYNPGYLYTVRTQDVDKHKTVMVGEYRVMVK